MSDPASIDAPKNVWTLITPSSVLQGIIVRLDDSPSAYYFTHRPTGSAPPPQADPGEPDFLGVPKFLEGRAVEMGFNEPTDVYVLCTGEDGRILVAV
jgi:hypothetical protein